MKILYILTGLGVLAMLAEIFNFKKYLYPVVLAGLACVFAAVVRDWNTNIHYYNNMLTFDNYALLFSAVIAGNGLLWMLANKGFLENSNNKTDLYALSFFSLCGAVIMVSYSNLVMLFLGIEILSIPIYVLAGSRKDDLASNESALKYFLMGAFASAFLLLGIALIYGACGNFDISGLGTYLTSPEPLTAWRGQGAETMLFAGIIILLIGMSFKIAAVPFHFWTPDVYQGAPTPVTAFMSTVVKTAGFAAFLRLFMTCFTGYAEVWKDVIWALAALSILLGNITAIYQTSVKRMLAYSSIAHAGYMLLALISAGDMSAGAVLYYSAAYTVTSIGAFAVLSNLPPSPSSRGGDAGGFDSLAGLAKRNKLMAVAMSVCMLSLAGIPPLAGFFGKYYLFASALQQSYVWLVLIAALGSLIGVYYYLKVIIAMYSGSSETDSITLSPLQSLLLVITIALTILLGVFPELIIRLI